MIETEDAIPMAQQNRIELLPGQTALVGYGSLLSIPSLERTLGHTYTGPFLPCQVNGWRRTWDAALANKSFYAIGDGGKFVPEEILYLNIHRDPLTVMNGVVFVVDEEELAAYDRREAVYDRVEITADIDVAIAGGPAYLYVCRPEHCRHGVRSPSKAAIRATYLKIVDNGLDQLGEEFRRIYEASTDQVPKHLVIEDRSSTLGA